MYFFLSPTFTASDAAWTPFIVFDVTMNMKQFNLVYIFLILSKFDVHERWMRFSTTVLYVPYFLAFVLIFFI